MTHLMTAAFLAALGGGDPQISDDGWRSAFTDLDATLGAPAISVQEADAEEAEEEKKKVEAWGFVWNGTLTAAMTIQRGNTSSESASVDTRWEGEDRNDQDFLAHRLTFTGAWYSSRQEDPDTRVASTTARRLNGTAKFDHFYTEKLFGYVRAAAAKDGVVDLDLRWNAGVGVGYQWIDEENENFYTEAGIGFTDEDYKGTAADESYISGRAALHYDRKLGENSEFFHDSEWQPSLEDFYEDQTVSTVTGIRANINSSLAMEAKVLFDLDTSPAPGRDRKDVTYIFGITYIF